ncbi:MAG: DUF6785 family protein [Armatimonadota bacterium]
MFARAQRSDDGSAGPALPPGARIPGRALLVGTAVVAILSLASPYLGAVSRTWDPGGSALPITGVVTLFALVLLNGLLARLLPGRSLTRVELFVAYAMVIMVVQYLYKGFTPFVTGATTWPFYMASGSNDWEHRLWPYLPVWFRPSTQQAAMWYWEGVPEGVGIPWAAWRLPLIAWGSFHLALLTAMFCLAALLSRDWIEKQKLAFPLVEIPLAITGEAERPTLRTSLLRSRVFWIGFAVPGALSTLGWFHALYPNVPSPQLAELDLGRYFSGMSLPWNVLSGDSGIHFTLSMPLTGIACLMPGEISLSIWLFYALYRVQQLVWASFGVAPGGSSTIAVDPGSFIAMEEAGGFIALSAVVLYQSRNALRAAALGLAGRAGDESGPYSALAGRWALLGFIGANAFLFWWARHSGMSWWSFAVLMGLFYCVMVGVSRLVAAAGLTHVDVGMASGQVVFHTIGEGPIGPVSSTVYYYLSTIYLNDPRIVLMAQAMNSFKLMHTGRVRARRLTLAALLAVLITLAIGLPTMLWIAYRHGAASLPDWPVAAPARDVFEQLDSSLRAPELPSNWMRLALATGAAAMLGMVAMHSRFVWWPVSPVGFLVASSWSINYLVWFSTLLGWAISTSVRRFGGLPLYRALRPAFIGLIIGGYIPEGFFALLSALLGIQPPRP